MSSKQHWETVYSTKDTQSVSWYQPHATVSLELIRQSTGDMNAAIIDVGAGASMLVDDLLASGYRNLTVLDLSREALTATRQRLGQSARDVLWLEGDITSMELPEQAYDVWHDRAVFHFLTDPADRRRYVAQVLRAVKAGGHVIVATFSAAGPTQCSGLPVMRYTPAALHGEFGEVFQLLEQREETHLTPDGREQHFIYCHCKITG